ncbi:tetratricopeptide repeat protein [Xanthomonas hortorum]|uniref:Tetratricopeptide repeat protein n=1 Tax=Xanthomonas hortorum pv. pelargonii TaxID=453602 RepID=A0A6V7BH71_9XANT|nr:tetratricopeptide repeat protein [Xanthomonas hortorum]MCE4354908.1 tetratricopeptide repeat protein [Xanthomonas hortorum pv. pelargonii]MCM5522654.1 tetratricopeptide repeat protein [Xanthomonas hortorum pv. pelargonii]MCM5534578.1 tetratricopeptide repeat protein [Xanthomonas hortorum pv. pelargonii]MCM5540883.1 tetratricopeptide repeat protein [Xanthomonas hortorum pv. pelargonii]MCM5544064.1 tetratricopeptide repeat protein [Xanthomonas hortorum pv. pelargonii]
MRTKFAWAIALALLGSVWSLAQAQSLPQPKEFYFDEDRGTTKAVVAVQGQGDAVVDRLAAMVQRDARAAEPRAQLASLAYAGGRTQLGDELYQGALGLVSSGSQQYRAITWNYGWDLLRADKADKALQLWANLANGRPATPQWLPTTVALALWRAGRKQEAVEWYAAAVRTWPERWSSTANYASLLPDWREAERASLAEVFAAWQANPPAFP